MFSKATLRKVTLFVHLWLGLTVGLYFSLIGLSGSLLVMRDYLEPLQIREISYVEPPTPATALLPVSAVMTKLRSVQPPISADDLAYITLPQTRGGAYRISVSAPVPAERRLLLIDPYTGSVISNIREQGTFFGFLYGFHIMFLMDTPGALLNGAGGYLAALLLLSGLCLWWPATLRQFKARIVIKRNAGFKRIVLELHHVFGSYSFVVLLLITTTGAILIFPQPVQKLVKILGVQPAPRERVRVLVPPGGEHLPMDTLIAAGERVMPSVQMTGFAYPQKPSQPFSCYKKRSTPGFSPNIQIYVDPYTAKILKVSDDIQAPTETKIRRTLSLLHFGYWGGFLARLLYALVGLLPSGLFVTGVMIYLRKRKEKSLRASR